VNRTSTTQAPTLLPYTALSRSRRTWLGNAILIVGAAAGHAAIGYFGYQWIRNNQAPTFSETLPATSKRADEISETTIHERDKPRSEEHTSELQSREKLVCRLLL